MNIVFGLCFIAGPSILLIVIPKVVAKIKSFLEKQKGKTKMPSTSPVTSKKKVIDLTLEKRGMETVLKIKAAKEIEDFFRKASIKTGPGTSPKTEVSNKWVDKNDEGLVFYLKNEKLSGKVSRYGNVMDNFGNGLLDDSGRFNLAILRIKGISDEDGVTIKTDDLTGYQEIREYIEKVAGWTKSFYEENLRDQELSASISFEV